MTLSFDTWPATIMLRRMRPWQQASMILIHKQQDTYPFQNDIPHDKVGYIVIIIIITSAGSSVKNSQSSSALATRRLGVQQGECWGQNATLFSDDVWRGISIKNFPISLKGIRCSWWPGDYCFSKLSQKIENPFQDNPFPGKPWINQ